MDRHDPPEHEPVESDTMGGGTDDAAVTTGDVVALLAVIIATVLLVPFAVHVLYDLGRWTWGLGG